MDNNIFNKGFRFTNRLITQGFGRRKFEINIDKPIISFTFDDFPQSAAQKGLEILTKYNVKATYYVSFGLIDKITATGKICSIEDVERILQTGNNLGCHTFNHHGAFEQNSSEFEYSLKENQKYLNNRFSLQNFSVFSYPKGQVSLKTKKIVQKHYKCSRGIIPGINNGNVDLNLLRGTRIYGGIQKFDWCKAVIDQNTRENGWLIFYTHDISDDPSQYGCTPALYEEVLKYSCNSGSDILDIERACSLLKIYL